MAYGSADKLLGEKYLYHVKGMDIHTRNHPLITGPVIDEAQKYFTRKFGVRIHNGDQLNALEDSVLAYQNISGDTVSDVPLAAIERAVSLKKNYFPESLWNWNEDDFNKLAYVAPIPNITIGGPPEENPVVLPPIPAIGDLQDPASEIRDAQAQQAAITAAANAPLTEPVVKQSFAKKALDYSKKNWWIALLPLPVIAIVVAYKHFKK